MLSRFLKRDGHFLIGKRPSLGKKRTIPKELLKEALK